jgi:hypothetical protein
MHHACTAAWRVQNAFLRFCEHTYGLSTLARVLTHYYCGHIRPTDASCFSIGIEKRKRKNFASSCTLMSAICGYFLLKSRCMVLRAGYVRPSPNPKELAS